MAVTRGQHTAVLTADGDALTGTITLTGLFATGAVASVTDGDDRPIWEATAAGQSMLFNATQYAKGIKRGAGAGKLYVYHT